MERDLQEILKKKNIKISIKQFKLNFFKKNLLDSIQFLELVSHIEKKYKINFSNKEISNNKFYSINGIMACLKKKLHVNKKKY